MANFRALGVALSRAADDKKGEDVALLHVGPVHPMADYVLIVTALSRPHMETLEHELRMAAKDMGVHCAHRARTGDHWRVLDFGGLVAHVMTSETRTFYALEKLHHGAKRVKWEPAPSRVSAGRPAKTARPSHARSR